MQDTYLFAVERTAANYSSLGNCWAIGFLDSSVENSTLPRLRTTRQLGYVGLMRSQPIRHISPVLDFCSLQNVTRPSNAVFATLPPALSSTPERCSVISVGARDWPESTHGERGSAGCSAGTDPSGSTFDVSCAHGANWNGILRPEQCPCF